MIRWVFGAYREAARFGRERYWRVAWFGGMPTIREYARRLTQANRLVVPIRAKRMSLPASGWAHGEDSDKP